MYLEDYPKKVVLKDGKEVILRPLREDDVEALLKFYAQLPDEDKWYLWHNVDDEDYIRRWVKELDFKKIIPIIAIDEDKIVAKASLLRFPVGSREHLGRLRIIVAPKYRFRRLGTWMILDIIKLALDADLEKLEAHFVRDIEEPAIQAARKMDFYERASIPNYIKDPEGNYHDLVIMIKRLNKGWDDF